MLRYSFCLFATALIFLSSCRDFVEPNVPYKDFDTGVYLRTIARTSTSFNFFDLASSKFALTIEAVDKEDGKTVQTVEVRVRHRRLIPGVGLRYTPANDVLVRTLQASDFKPNTSSRFLRADISVTAAEAIAAVGLTTAGILGIARVIGETAPLLLTSLSNNSYVFNPMGGPIGSLPTYVFGLLQIGTENSINRAWTGSLVLMLLVLVLFLTARYFGGKDNR